MPSIAQTTALAVAEPFVPMADADRRLYDPAARAAAALTPAVPAPRVESVRELADRVGLTAPDTTIPVVRTRLPLGVPGLAVTLKDTGQAFMIVDDAIGDFLAHMVSVRAVEALHRLTNAERAEGFTYAITERQPGLFDADNTGITTGADA